MKVLYATDGSESAFEAKDVLTRLFNKELVEIDVVTVTHSWSLDPRHLLIQIDPIHERREDSREIVDAAEQDLKDAGFKVSKKIVLEGAPGHELVKLAESNGYGMVVAGAGSRSWLGTRLLGSVSTYLLHEAPCSLLIAHGAPKVVGKPTVLVGTDGSAHAIATAKTLARVLDPQLCEVEVMSVAAIPSPVMTPMFAGPVVSHGNLLEKIDDELVKEAEGNVAAAADYFWQAGFHTSVKVDRGGGATVLLDEARQLGADLIGVGSRGHGPIRRALLGSVSDQIARHSRAAFIGRF